MTKAYLLLLHLVDDKDIYVDHDRKLFIVHYHEEEILIKCEDVKDFITIFIEDIDNILEKLNIEQYER